MSKKNTIRLTESDLKRVISESVKRVLKENDMSSEDTFTRRRRIEQEDHQQMWSYLNDAYNMSLNHEEGIDLYKQAFEDIIFPAIERVDRELGWIN